MLAKLEVGVADAAKTFSQREIVVPNQAAEPVTAPAKTVRNEPAPAKVVAAKAAPAAHRAQSSPQLGAQDAACSDASSCSWLTESGKTRFMRLVEAVRIAAPGGKTVPDRQQHDAVSAAGTGSAVVSKEPALLPARVIEPATPPTPAAPERSVKAHYSQSVASVIEALGGCKGGGAKSLCTKFAYLDEQLAQSAHSKNLGKVN